MRKDPRAGRPAGIERNPHGAKATDGANILLWGVQGATLEKGPPEEIGGTVIGRVEDRWAQWGGGEKVGADETE